jgi:hypothetical protein
MNRPLFLVRHDPPAEPFYADADQQIEPVPDVPLFAALLAFAWRKRVWMLCVLGGVVVVWIVFAVVAGTWALWNLGWRP